MDHVYVEKHDLVAAYLAGRLKDEERDAFEAHYFDCPTCLERLETADAFREGMRRVAAEDVARASVVRARLGLFAALAALSRRHRLALAGALLLIVTLPAGWLLERNRALRRELAAASAGAERQRAALAARLHEAEEARAGDRRRLTEELAAERERRSRESSVRPEVNVPIFLLAAVRSGEPADREPVSRFSLASATGSVLLTAELATVDFPFYRASLDGAGGREVWQAQGLHPDSRNTLVLLLPASMLQPGVYRLTIEGAKDTDRWFAVAVYPFRVVRRP